MPSFLPFALCILLGIIPSAHSTWRATSQPNSTATTVLTPSWRKLLKLDVNPPPMVFQIGEQKCGSSTLFDILHSHPGTCNATVLDGELPWAFKELNFFDRHSSTDEKINELPRYLSHFSGCPADLVRLDATPGYFTYAAKIPKQIKEVYTSLGIDTNELKFLLILRDPAYRLISAYEHYHRTGFIPETKTLNDIVEQGLARYAVASKKAAEKGRLYSAEGDMIGRGVYAPHIRRWFQVFQSHQFLILTLEQLMRDTAGTMAHVQQFLGLPQVDLSSLKHSNKGRYELPQMPENLVDFYAPHNEELLKLKDEHPEAFLDTPQNRFGF